MTTSRIVESGLSGPTDPSAEFQLRPMSEAPIAGPVLDILVVMTDRAGCRRWLVVHYAHGGGEDQPRFRGWFYRAGDGFEQISVDKLVGWLPLPELR